MWVDYCLCVQTSSSRQLSMLASLLDCMPQAAKSVAQSGAFWRLVRDIVVQAPAEAVRRSLLLLSLLWDVVGRRWFRDWADAVWSGLV